MVAIDSSVNRTEGQGGVGRKCGGVPIRENEGAAIGTVTSKEGREHQRASRKVGIVDRVEAQCFQVVVSATLGLRFAIAPKGGRSVKDWSALHGMAILASGAAWGETG